MGRKKECDHCGDTVVLPNRNETVVKGETPIEHLKRTGHNYRREPVLTGCHGCGTTWWYGGGADRATCPTCNLKVPAGTLPEDVDHEDAWAQANQRYDG